MALIQIDNVEICSPTAYSVGIQDISKAERNANGTMIKQIISTKVKLELTWDVIESAELSKILNLVDSNFFNVTYLDPKTDSMTTKTFYVSDRKAAGMIFKGGKMTHWSGFTFSLVER